MVECADFHIRMFCFCFIHDKLCCFIDTSYCTDNPDFVTYAYAAIFTFISVKICCFCFLFFGKLRFICIFQNTVEVCFCVMCMNVFSLFDITGCIADGVSVFYNVLPFFDIAFCNFMTAEFTVDTYCYVISFVYCYFFHFTTSFIASLTPIVIIFS